MTICAQTDINSVKTLASLTCYCCSNAYVYRPLPTRKRPNKAHTLACTHAQLPYHSSYFASTYAHLSLYSSHLACTRAQPATNLKYSHLPYILCAYYAGFSHKPTCFTSSMYDRYTPATANYILHLRGYTHAQLPFRPGNLAPWSIDFGVDSSDWRRRTQRGPSRPTQPSRSTPPATTFTWSYAMPAAKFWRTLTSLDYPPTYLKRLPRRQRMILQ